MNAEKQSFRKMMNGLNKMMQERGSSCSLPHDLRRRLRSFFLSNKHQAQFARDQKLLAGMSPQLQTEVAITLPNWQWLLKVPFFREFIKIMDIKDCGINTDPYRACIADVAHHMEPGRDCGVEKSCCQEQLDKSTAIWFGMSFVADGVVG
eukprot:Skav207029  [mRNA]  locus=scaffold4972:2059:5072:- [translate_table: standard]